MKFPPLYSLVTHGSHKSFKKLIDHQRGLSYTIIKIKILLIKMMKLNAEWLTSLSVQGVICKKNKLSLAMKSES